MSKSTVPRKTTTKAQKAPSKTTTVAKGVKISRGKEKVLRKKRGGSSTGKYKNVAPKDFAGKSGGTSPYSFPIPDIAHARNAISRSHFAPNPSGIRAAVYKKFPQLKKRKLELEGKSKTRKGK